MTLTNFNNNNVKIVVQKIKEAVLDVSMKYGVDITLEDVKYSDVSFTCTLQGIISDSEIQSMIRKAEHKQVLDYCNAHGMQDMYGKEIVIEGVLYKVVGLTKNLADTFLIESTESGAKYPIATSVLFKYLKVDNTEQAE